MNYTCPNPECKSGWTLGESVYLGGTLFNCGECKKVTTIPLYCPHCYPKSVPDKKYLQTPPGFLGGESYTCGACRKSFTVPVFTFEVHERLKSMGTELGQYSQSKRIDTLPNQRLKGIVSGGYCAGVVYDWVRRILLGGKSTYQEGKIRPDVRVAYAWTQQTSEKKNIFLNQKGDQLHQAVQLKRTADFSQADQELAELSNKVDAAFEKINKATGLSNQQRQELYAKAQKFYDDGVRDIRQKRDSKVSEYTSKVNTWNSKPVMERFWGEFSRVMDDYLLKDRLSRGKTGESARKFSDLIVARSADSASYNGLAAFIDALLRDTEFQTNRAAYVSVTPPTEGATGHAIGIFRQNTGRYYLFDPNIGTYELSAANLRESFIYIFKKAYPNMGGGDTSDNHDYEIRGKVLGGYTIFEGAHPPVPSVTVISPPITLSVKPPVLTPITTQPKFEPIIPTRPVPQSGQRVFNNNPKPNPSPSTGAPPRTGGGNVSDLISRFNK